MKTFYQNNLTKFVFNLIMGIKIPYIVKKKIETKTLNYIIFKVQVYKTSTDLKFYFKQVSKFKLY